MPKKGGGERREDGRRGGKELELLVADVRRAATGREEGGGIAFQSQHDETKDEKPSERTD